MPSCLIAGGGAAGLFAAISCAEKNPRAQVTVCEAGPRPLAKVRISGGGRCNVTCARFDPAELVLGYPRGARELLGPFHRWQPRDTVAWFADHGVELKTEADGRMFPLTDDSATVIDCLLAAADRAGVRLRTRAEVREAARISSPGAQSQYAVRLAGGESLACERLLLATGGGRDLAGPKIAASLGHSIAPPVPSLFTFHIEDPRLAGLEGISVPDALARQAGGRLSARGPALVTHWGLSGPAILKLSAWGAREFAACNYRFELALAWRGDLSPAGAEAELAAARAAHPRRRVAAADPLGLPQRLWERLVSAAGIGPEVLWSGVSKASVQALAAQVTTGRFAVAGKSLNKEEFVTCGGVRLDEVDFRTMESRRSPGLFLAGEILDIDGITGGYNLQAAWTTGRIAGLALGEP